MIPDIPDSMYKALFISTMALLTVKCTRAPKSLQPGTSEPHLKAASKTAAASWLLGRWENNSKEGNLSEIWRKASDSLYTGESYFVVGNDTVFRERMDLVEKKDGEQYFIATIPGQNSEKPVAFKRVGGTETEMTFTNPEHDYPTTIEYRRVAEDSLVATISGNKRGKTESGTFKLKRVQ